MSFSQKSDSLRLPKNSLSIELAGNACGFGSINYERVFPISDKFYISGRVGVGGFYYMNISSISIPILGNVIFKIVNILSLEAGLGTTLFFKTKQYSPAESGLDPLLTGLIGIRLQHPGKGFCFRAGFTPIIDLRSTDPYVFTQTFTPLAGFSFGYSF
jgi:hypothetical protein